MLLAFAPLTLLASPAAAQPGPKLEISITPVTTTFPLSDPDTVPITVEELLMLSAAVRRGLKTPLLVGDLPFGSYEASDAQAIATAHRFVKEAGCDADKLEGGGTMAERARVLWTAAVDVASS